MSSRREKDAAAWLLDALKGTPGEKLAREYVEQEFSGERKLEARVAGVRAAVLLLVEALGTDEPLAACLRGLCKAKDVDEVRRLIREAKAVIGEVQS